MNAEHELAKRYSSALSQYLAETEETPLSKAYEFGREALNQWQGVLTIAEIHKRALANALSRLPEQDVHTITQTVDVLSEALAPFEMTLRGYRETIEALRTEIDVCRHAEEKLREAQEDLARKERLAMLGRLAGGVGHELRNPLGVITNAVYFLKTALPDANDTVKEYLSMISSEVANAEKIVSDLLDLSRNRFPDRHRVELAEVISGVLARQTSPAGVTATIEIGSDLPPVFVDGRQMAQVFANLVTNAYQSMDNGGTLVIRACEETDCVEISFSDTGCGIPVQDLARVFEPLVTTKARGIGVGLTVPKKLVEINGGCIRVESEEGKGATFAVRLPTKEAQP